MRTVKSQFQIADRVRTFVSKHKKKIMFVGFTAAGFAIIGGIKYMLTGSTEVDLDDLENTSEGMKFFDGFTTENLDEAIDKFKTLSEGYETVAMFKENGGYSVLDL